MKVVLLAGGFGTRISEESQFKPKPMIEIGGKPIEYYGAAEPPVRCGESHLSGLTEPPVDNYSA